MRNQNSASSTSASVNNALAISGWEEILKSSLRPGPITLLVQRHCGSLGRAVTITYASSSGGRSFRKRSLPVMRTNTPGSPATRRFPRYTLDIRVSARVFRADAQVALWGRSIEFGQDGIGVTLTGELEPGEVATLELTLPNSIPMKLRALVRYRDGLRHGFEFLARDEVQREAIRRTCELLSASS
jgi:PilZ domain